MRQLPNESDIPIVQSRPAERLRLGDLQCLTPRWSPKGGLIAFGTRWPRRAVYVMKTDTTGLRQLTDTATEARDPSWSPDGRRLVCSIRQGNYWRIAIVRLSGGAPIPITEANSTAFQPAWSPDGSHIAFAMYNNGRSDIHVVPAGGGKSTRLTDGPSANVCPAWSPDGDTIAFATDREGSWRVYTMRPDGTQQAHAADVVAEWPAWRPDGAALAYAGTTEPRSARGPLPRGICVMDLREGAVHLLRAGALGYAPNWSPDGTKMVFVRNFRLYMLDVSSDELVPLAGE